MHAIKTAARREAWYNNNDPNNRTYNIWGRVDTNPRRRRDLEEGGSRIHHVQTENDAPSPIEQSRRADNFSSNAPFALKSRSATYPERPTQQPNASIDEKSRDMGSEDISSAREQEESNDPEKLSEPSSTSPRDPNVPEHAEPGPRQRRNIREIMLCAKKDTSEDGNLTRTKSSASRKSRKQPKLTIMSQVKAVFGSWINILLVFVPIGIAVANVDGFNKIAVFVINFVAIVPLAAMLSYATEEFAMYVGETLGGLLNATFGNAVELIVSIIALTKGEIIIVQTSLIGSMLSNLLLVLGMCFFFGGLKRTEQHFNITVAQTAASLLSLAIGALIIPTAFRYFSPQDNGVAPISRGTAILLLILYACYLYFQLSTHVEMYNEPSKKVPKRPSKHRDAGDVARGIATMGAGNGAAYSGGKINEKNLVRKDGEDDDDDDDEETPRLTRIGALITLGASTVLVAFCAEYLVSAIGAITGAVSPEFVGLILLPIVGNAAEHATAVTVAIKDKMDLSIGVAVGSSLQIALLVLPLTVLLSWFGVGKGVLVDGMNEGPMTLNFDGFLIAVIFVAMIEVNYLIQDGKSHWLEGVMLMTTYVVIALSSFFYPTDTNFSE